MDASISAVHLKVGFVDFWESDSILEYFFQLIKLLFTGGEDDIGVLEMSTRMGL